MKIVAIKLFSVSGPDCLFRNNLPIICQYNSAVSGYTEIKNEERERREVHEGRRNTGR